MRVEADSEDEETVTIRRWFPESGHERTPNREQLEEFGWRYLRATRGASIRDGAHSPVRTLLAAADLGSNEEGLTALLDQFNEKLAGNESVSELLDRVATHLSRSMPRTVSQDDFSVRSVTDPSSDVLQDVTIFLNRGDDQVSLTEQSDGVRQLMSMTLFDLAEGTANVLAIDEPEIHLHPTSQRTAADLLSGDGNQKIIVTHSPYILHRFEPSEVVAVDRHGRCHQVGEAKLSKIEKVRAHWWSPRLLEALTARFVILVEGDADRVIVTAVAENLGIDLDRLGAVVVELDGADKFRNVFPLLASIHRSVLGELAQRDRCGLTGRGQGRVPGLASRSSTSSLVLPRSRRWSAGRCRWWRVRGREQAIERGLPWPGLGQVQNDPARGSCQACRYRDECSADRRGRRSGEASGAVGDHAGSAGEVERDHGQHQPGAVRGEHPRGR